MTHDARARIELEVKTDADDVLAQPPESAQALSKK
jgi:hypothetical protein